MTHFPKKILHTNKKINTLSILSLKNNSKMMMTTMISINLLSHQNPKQKNLNPLNSLLLANLQDLNKVLFLLQENLPFNLNNNKNRNMRNRTLMLMILSLILRVRLISSLTILLLESRVVRRNLLEMNMMMKCLRKLLRISMKMNFEHLIFWKFN